MITFITENWIGLTIIALAALYAFDRMRPAAWESAISKR